MAEFHDVPARGIELADDIAQPGLSVAVAWRKLKQEASHAVAQYVGDHPEILHERLRALELLDVGDVLADLDRVDELLLPRLASPGLNARDRGPRVEGGIDLDGVEVLQVVREPVVLPS